LHHFDVIEIEIEIGIDFLIFFDFDPDPDFDLDNSLDRGRIQCQYCPHKKNHPLKCGSPEATVQTGLLGRNLCDMRHGYVTSRQEENDGRPGIIKKRTPRPTQITYKVEDQWMPGGSGPKIDQLDAPRECTVLMYK